MTTIKITLPDQLAQDAERAGLLSSAQLERWIREQLNAQHADRLLSTMRRIHSADAGKPMSPEEVAEEIATMRAERRAKSGV